MAAFRTHWAGRHHNLDRLERLHRAVLVEGRHLAVPMEEYTALNTFGKRNDAWIRVALEVGQAALEQALELAGIGAAELDALWTTTVTGVATPSLDARLMNRMPLPTHLRRTPVFGLGCVAGAAGLARAADWLHGRPHGVAGLLSVELCSLTLQREDLSIPNLVSTGLFGDGAAAAVLVGEEHPSGRTGPRVVDSRSVFYPDTERVMGWDVSEDGFQIVLSADVPRIVLEHLRCDVDAFLSAHGLTVSEVGSFVCHPGGPKVLEAFEVALDQPREAFALTWDCLARVGNLSSSSVLFVLKETMERHRPPPGTPGLLLAMGPAFCSELVLLEW